MDSTRDSCPGCLHRRLLPAWPAPGHSLRLQGASVSSHHSPQWTLLGPTPHHTVSWGLGSSASPLIPSVFHAEPRGAVRRGGKGRKSTRLGPSRWAGPAAILGQGQHQAPSSMIDWPPGSTRPIPTTFTHSDRRPSPWGWEQLTEYVGVLLRRLPDSRSVPWSSGLAPLAKPLTLLLLL